jgi:hypothetical protein
MKVGDLSMPTDISLLLWLETIIPAKHLLTSELEANLLIHPISMYVTIVHPVGFLYGLETA